MISISDKLTFCDLRVSFSLCGSSVRTDTMRRFDFLKRKGAGVSDEGCWECCLLVISCWGRRLGHDRVSHPGSKVTCTAAMAIARKAKGAADNAQWGDRLSSRETPQGRNLGEPGPGWPDCGPLIRDCLRKAAWPDLTYQQRRNKEDSLISRGREVFLTAAQVRPVVSCFAPSSSFRRSRMSRRSRVWTPRSQYQPSDEPEPSSESDIAKRLCRRTWNGRQLHRGHSESPRAALADSDSSPNPGRSDVGLTVGLPA